MASGSAAASSVLPGRPRTRVCRGCTVGSSPPVPASHPRPSALGAPSSGGRLPPAPRGPPTPWDGTCARRLRSMAIGCCGCTSMGRGCTGVAPPSTAPWPKGDLCSTKLVVNSSTALLVPPCSVVNTVCPGNGSSGPRGVRMSAVMEISLAAGGSGRPKWPIVMRSDLEAPQLASALISCERAQACSSVAAEHVPLSTVSSAGSPHSARADRPA
mmetsp:Transcript_59831/g.185697  ORF Transcript_59831/g.185697 Transcript_59831/m.185697 type:complete len:214 (+) Transcript_59831:643-1284(+)